MSKTTAGWIIFIAALGMMCSLMATDVGKLQDWNEAAKPAFVAVVMAHFGAVVTAFIGGKLIPENRNGKERTRKTDPNDVEEKQV